jgi:hypothetical protein
MECVSRQLMNFPSEQGPHWRPYSVPQSKYSFDRGQLQCHTRTSPIEETSKR